MAGIAGIASENRYAEVAAMLDRISHRGNSRRKIIEAEGTTLGVCWNEPEIVTFGESEGSVFVRDTAGFEHFANATAYDGTFLFSRDAMGVAPLYAGYLPDGTTGFASEVKALVPEMKLIEEVKPGTGTGPDPGDNLTAEQHTELSSMTPESLALHLKQLLDDAVSVSIRTEDTGAWLSGGLDSAAITSLATNHLGRMKTFTAGVEGAPDLEYAALTARYLGTEHHEIIVGINDLVALLPEVIYHLESFDPLLVRSSLLNFIVSRSAAGHVSDIFTGEGADELFAGYHYLNSLLETALHDELLRLTGKLHNTALQRVDRCASAFGLTPRLIFTQPPIRKLAFSLPADYMIVNGEGKWLLRKAVEKLLPHEITWRSKAKFWEGGGVNEKLSEIADSAISDSDFRNERLLPNGWTLSGKEELFYYRIFSDFFGDDISLSWMGRTDKGTAVA